MDLPAAPPRHGRTRLEVELEFVQCLANPFYLNHLAHTKLLEDERFLNYLEYLNYFRQPEYAKLLLYGHPRSCLPLRSSSSLATPAVLRLPRLLIVNEHPGLGDSTRGWTGTKGA